MSDRSPHIYFINPYPGDVNRPLLIFLPGMDETGMELMKVQTASLQQMFDIRCLVIPSDNFATWDILTHKTIELIRAEIGQNSRLVYLCAESFGSCIGLKVLESAPELCDRVILINSASSFKGVLLLNLGSYLVRWTPHILYDLASTLSLLFLARITRLSPHARAALQQAVSDAPKHTSVKRLELLRNFKLDNTKLQQVTQPVLLIGSQRDRLLPSVREARRLAQIFPNTQIVTLPDSGHACLAETAIDLSAIVQAHQC